jgi:hypothetical protein
MCGRLECAGRINAMKRWHAESLRAPYVRASLCFPAWCGETGDISSRLFGRLSRVSVRLLYVSCPLSATFARCTHGPRYWPAPREPAPARLDRCNSADSASQNWDKYTDERERHRTKQGGPTPEGAPKSTHAWTQWRQAEAKDEPPTTRKDKAVSVRAESHAGDARAGGGGGCGSSIYAVRPHPTWCACTL